METNFILRNKMTNKNIVKISFVVCLVAIAVGWRIINHNFNFAPNLELVTAASVLAAVILGWRWAIVVPIVAMVISDLIIGNTSIFMFTWASFALIGIGATVLAKLNKKPKSQILSSVGFAIISSFVFFIVTNFGVWAQGWYPATLAGLTDCFIMAVPFYRTMLIGNLIIVPIVISAWQLVKNYQTVKESVVNSFIR